MLLAGAEVHSGFMPRKARDFLFGRGGEPRQQTKWQRAPSSVTSQAHFIQPHPKLETD